MRLPVLFKETICMPEELPFPINDYGFLYGVGLFETTGVVNSKPFLLKEHLDRLYSGLKELGIQMSFSKEDFKSLLLRYLHSFEKNTSSGRLNIYVTAGDRLPDKPIGTYGEPTWLAVFSPDETVLNPFLKESKLAVRNQTYKREPMPHLKSLCYMGSILEKRAAVGFDDVILLDDDSTVLETAFASLFLYIDGEWVTSDSPFILNGITRKWLLDNQLSLEVSFVQRHLKQSDLLNATDIFLAQSVSGVGLVSEVENFGHLKSGDIARSLSERVLCIWQEY